MAVRGVFFDAADVLYRRPVPTSTYVSNLLQQMGLPAMLSPEDGMRHATLRSEANKGTISSDEYWDRFLSMHGIAGPETRKSLVEKIDGYSDNILPIPGGKELLAELKRRGFIVGVITDTIYPIERKMLWLDMVGVSEFIDVVACSTAVGEHKPNPAIYLAALQRAGLAPHESVFVGHATDELDGARRAGITTVAVNYDLDARADYYAHSLADLLYVPLLKEPDAGKGKALTHDIEAIFIDVGHTLRVLVKDESYQARAREKIATLVGTQEPADLFCERLDARYKVYRKWAFECLREASEKELWTRWLLPDWPAERIAPLANELTYLYRQTMGHRHARPEVRDVVEELTRRGYHLGILSNTITEREIPEWLDEDDLRRYFPTMVLSSIFGHRKPGPEIYLEAARQAGVHPSRAAYVADNPIRDVEGTRAAGFGMIIILLDPADGGAKTPDENNQPDLIIENLTQLLDVFPGRQMFERAH